MTRSSDNGPPGTPAPGAADTSGHHGRSRPSRLGASRTGGGRKRWKKERKALRHDLRVARRERDRLEAQRDTLVAELHGRTDGLGHVFVVTYGRSGSTLLAGILSSIPGYLIRGENDQVGEELFAFYQRLVGARDAHRDHAATAIDPWFGIDGFSDELVLDRVRDLLTASVLRPDAGTRVVGFKETRWWFEGGVEYLAFLRQVFPGARFVLNTRDHEDVATSGWWNDAEHPLLVLRDREAMMDEMAERFGDAVYRVHYDDYVADPGTLRGLFAWLGEPFDEDAVRALLTVQHSY